jgi:N-glycosylase/DNA lyase
VDYFQFGVDLDAALSTFPSDPAMAAAVEACRGLRLLKQEPWECLASFILSSSKQIVQIRQIVSLLCERYGEQIAVPAGGDPVYAFPAPQRLAGCSEEELRACKMGFRAPYLLQTAKWVANGNIDLARLSSLSLAEARQELMKFPGVGRKVADCALLFGFGFATAFPVDVWVLKALQRLYFPKRRAGAKRILRFSETYFGPHAGLAQQYLFHYMRTKIA